MADAAARLLIVDDNKVNRLLLSRSVQLQGHSAALAENGRVALEMLGREPFDLVLLVIEMPEVDGFTVCRKIKEDPKLKELPVIFLTAKGGGEALAEGFESGAIMYINKPFTANKLLTIVNTMLETRAS